ncbi:FAD-dependent oxidoreductase [Streptomyces sp. NPDC003077]|uniref:FAD-dependent oxidoreductase n=1 Tax=Streptomyces sp. NPDC003077 TaxID=3154443 RepID=UPI0033BB328C
MNDRHDTDLLVVGAGPAGCAAALMAASLGMRTLVVEPGRVGGKLHAIPALENVPGAWRDGPALAQALAADLARVQQDGRCALVAERAVGVAGHPGHAEVRLADGRVLAADAVVVATGVTEVGPGHTAWTRASPDLSPPPLWRARPDELSGDTYVLGGDRPLGTWLRAHPAAPHTLHVLYPPADAYKVREVARDTRVRLVPVEHVTVRRDGRGYLLETRTAEGERVHRADTLLGNLGGRPAVLDGLSRNADGYCPPGDQHPRILTAGDLRSSRFQRVATAQGSGAEAALTWYYRTALPRE